MIINRIRQWIIPLSIRTSWSGRSQRIATSLEDFASTEADSAWQMLQAAQYTSDPSLRLAFLLNALEELEHASLFTHAAKPYREQPTLAKSIARQRLCTSPEDLGHFMAYQFVGEQEIHEQFGCYVRACPDPAIRQIFTRIEADEGCHQEEARERLQEWFPGHRATVRAIRMASLQRDMECLARCGYGVGNAVLTVILLPVFTLSGLLFKRNCQQKLLDGHWFAGNAAIRHLRILE
jgi:rubrerythrin